MDADKRIKNRRNNSKRPQTAQNNHRLEQVYKQGNTSAKVVNKPVFVAPVKPKYNTLVYSPHSKKKDENIKVPQPELERRNHDYAVQSTETAYRETSSTRSGFNKKRDKSAGKEKKF